MAAKPLPQSIKDAILTDWRLGQMSQQAIAEKHGVSKGAVNKACKGVERDALPANSVPGIMTEPCSKVYLITASEFSGIFKIGKTNDVSRRIADLQTGCPYKLFAFREFSVSNPTAVEIMLHAFFHKKRHEGEWFSLNETDIMYIDEALEGIEEAMNGNGNPDL